MTNQIKSKSRVVDFGEVYTNSREVSSMLDLVKHKSYDIESTFLEPACGNGNFLIEILKRKLKTVRKKYHKSQIEYEVYAFKAISSIYGIDILEDNVEFSKKRLYQYLSKQYKSIYKESCNEDFLMSIQYVLNKNMICGNSIAHTTKEDRAKSIIFSKWDFPTPYHIKRTDYIMSEMEALNEFKTKKENLLVPYKEFDIKNFKEVYLLG